MRNGSAVRQLVLLALALCGALPAQAGSWLANTPQGQILQIVQDSYRQRDAYLLERRYPDGSLDPLFGRQGVTAFVLGPDNEGPSALRLDAAGRAWVAGAALAADGRSQAVLLRFTAQGQPDAAYAQQGRAATAPPGMGARALDLWPLADGSAWVAGLVTGERGEHGGWWRMRPDGQVDTRFADGGWWLDAEAGETEPLDLSVAPDGSVALGLRRGQGAQALAEIWVLAAGQSRPQMQLRQAALAERAQRLRWHEGRWGWVDAQGRPLPSEPARAEAPPAPAPLPAAASQALSAGPSGAAAAPLAAVPPAAPPAAASWGWAWLAGALLLVCGAALLAWRRRQRSMRV